jgi:hypothetical protein
MGSCLKHKKMQTIISCIYHNVNLVGLVLAWKYDYILVADQIYGRKIKYAANGEKKEDEGGDGGIVGENVAEITSITCSVCLSRPFKVLEK